MENTIRGASDPRLRGVLLHAASCVTESSYQKEWPLEPGHEKREVVYNLYHILNHHVLFGGGYLGSAQRMIGQILQM